MYYEIMRWHINECSRSHFVGEDLSEQFEQPMSPSKCERTPTQSTLQKKGKYSEPSTSKEQYIKPLPVIDLTKALEEFMPIADESRAETAQYWYENTVLNGV